MSFELETDKKELNYAKNGFIEMEDVIKSAGLSPETQNMIMREGEGLGEVLGQLGDDREPVTKGILNLSILAATPPSQDAVGDNLAE